MASNNGRVVRQVDTSIIDDAGQVVPVRRITVDNGNGAVASFDVARTATPEQIRDLARQKLEELNAVMEPLD